MPRCRLSATFSAAWRQTLQVRNRLSPSFHSPLALSRHRGGEATRNLETPWAGVVQRGSGPWDDQYFYAEKDLWKDAKLRRFLPSWDLMARTRRRMLRPETDYGSALYAQSMSEIIAEGGYGAVGGHGQFIGMDTHFDIR